MVGIVSILEFFIYMTRQSSKGWFRKTRQRTMKLNRWLCLQKKSRFSIETKWNDDPAIFKKRVIMNLKEKLTDLRIFILIISSSWSTSKKCYKSAANFFRSEKVEMKTGRKQAKKKPRLLGSFCSASGGRTHTMSPSTDFKRDFFTSKFLLLTRRATNLLQMARSKKSFK